MPSGTMHTLRHPAWALGFPDPQRGGDAQPFTLLAELTPLQQRAFQLLDVDPATDVAISRTP